MSLSTIDGDLTIRGKLSPVTLNAPVSCIGDPNIDGSRPISCLNLQHQFLKTYAQANGSATITERHAVHVGYGSTLGNLVAVRAGVKTPNIGAATITIDVQANGVTVMTAVITLNNTQIAYQIVNGSIATAAYAAGAVFEVVVTATAGGGTLGQGLFVDLLFQESAN